MGATDTRAEAPRRPWRGSAGFVCLLCIAPALFAGATLGFRALRKARAEALEARRHLQVLVRKDGELEVEGKALAMKDFVKVLLDRGHEFRGPDGITELDVTVQPGESAPWVGILKAMWHCQDTAVYLVSLKEAQSGFVLPFMLPKDTGGALRRPVRWNPSDPPERFKASLWDSNVSREAPSLLVALAQAPNGVECRVDKTLVTLRRNLAPNIPFLGDRLRDMGARSGSQSYVYLDAGSALPADVVLFAVDAILQAGFWEVRFRVPREARTTW